MLTRQEFSPLLWMRGEAGEDDQGKKLPGVQKLHAAVGNKLTMSVDC